MFVGITIFSRFPTFRLWPYWRESFETGKGISGVRYVGGGASAGVEDVVSRSALDAYCAEHDVSYKSLGENSFVTTWEENGTIVYVRELVSDSVVHAVWIEYPSSTSDRGNAIVEQVVPTRKALG